MKSRFKKYKVYSHVFINTGNREIQRELHPNFWKWKRKTRKKFISKRWPTADHICDGTPVSMGGRYMFI